MYTTTTEFKNKRLFTFKGLDLDLNTFKSFQTYITVNGNIFHAYKETAIGMVVVRYNFYNIYIELIK